MKEKILKIVRNEAFLYLFFGLLTTVVNYASFLLFLQFLGYDKVLTVNTISFVFASSFAYITNKLFVFQSKSWGFKVLCKEILSFFSARILSYFFEQIGLYVSTDIMNLERFSIFGIDGILISKVILSFLAVLLNWVFSKFFIFKKG
ncbi:MAG: GtrA family protein [Acutalibacteraceae bacterium]